MARQDSRHRSPENDRDADWNWHNYDGQAMLPECLMNVCQRKSSIENYKWENTPTVVRRSNTRTPSKPSTYQQSWEQIAQDWAKWWGLIRRGADEYEAKRISEAKQKHAQWKARAKTSPTELSSSDLSCFICNRQFRANIGLISHLRIHKQSHFKHLIKIGHCQ